MTDTAVPDIDANYAVAYGGRLSFGKRPAVLVVDVVRAYLDPASPLFVEPGAVLAANQRLVAKARALGLPVLFTNVVYQADGADGGFFYRKVPSLRLFDKGSPFGDFSPALQPQPNEIVVTKQYASAFFGTPLASTLRALGIDTLLITGFSTSGCVRATALDALQNGFIPFVVRDACGDRHPAPHDANLFDLQAKYAEVVSEAEAIRLMDETAMHPAASR